MKQRVKKQEEERQERGRKRRARKHKARGNSRDGKEAGITVSKNARSRDGEVTETVRKSRGGKIVFTN